jgi:hypothetical protein
VARSNAVRRASIATIIVASERRGDLTRTLVADKRESIVFPTLDASDHLLDRSPEPGDACRCSVGSVALRPSAIHDDQQVGRIRGKRALRDSAMRKVDGSRHVAAREELGAPNVENDEARRIRLEGFVDVPTVRLKL